MTNAREKNVFVKSALMAVPMSLINYWVVSYSTLYPTWFMLTTPLMLLWWTFLRIPQWGRREIVDSFLGDAIVYGVVFATVTFA